MRRYGKSLLSELEDLLSLDAVVHDQRDRVERPADMSAWTAFYSGPVERSKPSSDARNSNCALRGAGCDILGV